MRGEDLTTQNSEDTLEPCGTRTLALRGILPGDDTHVVIDGSELAVGRSAECDVRLDFARVSRRHFEIYKRGPLFALRDLGSTNGTYVEGKRVEHLQLEPGMLLRAGEWLGVVERIGADGKVRRFREIGPGIWGGAELDAVLEPLLAVARSNLPVVLIGRTGTGKERFARAVHAASGRTGPFHALNCAALTPTLAEAELFGYRKGAFTGADHGRLGQLRAANGGTLFLDELAELTAPVQAKLLRALELYEVIPVGDDKAVPFDARLVAASPESLSELVEQGRFRQDLAARLSGITVNLPTLRERRADVPSLFERFLREHSGATAPPVSTRLFEQLCLCEWPANVRELEFVARRLLVANGLEPRLRRSHLPPELLSSTSSLRQDKAAVATARAGADTEIDRLIGALRTTGGNVRLAAESIGISRQRAYRLIGSRRLTNVVSAARGAAEDPDGRFVSDMLALGSRPLVDET